VNQGVQPSVIRDPEGNMIAFVGEFRVSTEELRAGASTHARCADRTPAIQAEAAPASGPEQQHDARGNCAAA
jgi:hypothetical protein